MMRVPAIAGFGAAIQVVAGALIILFGRWPVSGWLVLVAYVAFLLHAATSRHLLGGLACWWHVAITVALWQAPALVFGVWNLIAFATATPAFDTGIFVLQLWDAVFIPLLAWIPHGEWHQIGIYLWLWSAWPVLVCAIQVIVRRRPPIRRELHASPQAVERSP